MIHKYCCQMGIEKIGMEYRESRIAETDVSEWLPRYALPHSYPQAKYITGKKCTLILRVEYFCLYRGIFSRSKLLCYKISRTTFKILMMVQILFLKACYILPILRTHWNSMLSCFLLYFLKTCNISR